MLAGLFFNSAETRQRGKQGSTKSDWRPDSGLISAGNPTQGGGKAKNERLRLLYSQNPPGELNQRGGGQWEKTHGESASKPGKQVERVTTLLR